MRKLLSSVIVTMFIAIMGSSFVFAVDADPGNRADVQDVERANSDNAADKSKEKAVYKCESSSSKVDALTTRYKKAYEKRVQTYSNITTRIQDVLTNIDASGYDTADAEAALNQFQVKVNETESSWVAFENQMQVAKESLCDADNADAFKGELTKSRNQLKEMRNVMTALRTHYNDNVKPELLALREQIQIEEESVTETDVVDVQE